MRCSGAFFQQSCDIGGHVQNGVESGHFALADAVLACQLIPEQYNFGHLELGKGDSCLKEIDEEISDALTY
jgi:hypothetical protein